MLGSVPVDPLYSSALIRLVAVFGVGVALAVAIATGVALWAGRQDAIAAAASNAGSLARALTDSVARSVNSIDVTLASVAESVRDGDLADDRKGGLARQVAQRLQLAPHIRQIVVVGLDGHILFDSAAPPRGRHVDISATLDDLNRLPRSLVIGAPMAGRFMGDGARAAGHSLVPVSAAVRNRDGSIVSLVVAAINPEYFSGMFHEIEQESGARVRLWRYDGVLLAGEVAMVTTPPTSRSTLPLFAVHLKKSEMGGFIDHDDDGVKRITSYRTTLAWPLVVSVGIPMDRALANWRRNLDSIAVPVGLVSLVVLGLTVVLVRTLARRARDEARLRLSDRVLANVSNGVTIADASSGDLPLLYVNQAFEQITGYGAAEVLGRNARFLHDGEADQEGLDRIREALAEGRAVTVLLRNVRADGTPFWNHVSLSPVRNSTGVITHWVGVQRDVTHEEEARAALAAAYDDVARTSADLERFSFVLAHHLQEPARQMRLQAQLLMLRLGPDASVEEKTPAERIISASARLVDMLRGVQSYLAMEREQVKGVVADVARALNTAVAKYAPGCPGGTLTVEHGALPQVAMSQRRLDELFDILVKNAVDFRHPDRPPLLVLDAEPDGRFWRLRLRDNGIGIEATYFERIFVPLERLHHHAGPAGTGIGLAIARKIVEAADGSIHVDSDGTSGSTFVFTLPAA
ncbi:sensor histidine kinase [Paramagnetospirillum marisnigri]|uniref:sensor histidine kinase n=1 Tax=Paramagnetospirillum marisnigri TaxID=1285242 RepID=UPI000AA3E428|nr:PAS domain-containing protein [Paramagnetospirillum marisnigri]